LKKLAAILLLILFVFNTAGYRLWFNYVQTRADADFVAKLDNGKYNEDELITVKVPINLPYQTTSINYERVDGEITINGKIYKYVKRAVVNDTMILLCISHDEKTQLQQKANDYFGKVSDLPGNDNNKKAEIFKQLTSDYDFNYAVASIQNIETQAVFNLYKNTLLPASYMPVDGQPPERMA